MAVEGILKKKQNKALLLSLKPKPEVEKIKKQSVTVKSRPRVRTRLLSEIVEGHVASKVECVASDMIRSSNGKVSSFTLAGGCNSDKEHRSTCPNWIQVKLQKQREEAHRSHQLCEIMEGAAATKLEIVAPRVVFSSDNKVTSLNFTHAGSCISEQEFKSICTNWRRIKLQKQREEARKKLEGMSCTAGFLNNIDSMLEFEKLLGIKPQWITTLDSH